MTMRKGYQKSPPGNPLGLLRSHRHGRRHLLRKGFVEASARRRDLAYSSFHPGRLLAGGPLGSRAGTLLRKGPRVQHSGPPGCRSADPTRWEWPPSVRARAGVGYPASRHQLGFRQTRKPSTAPQSEAARGRHSAIGGDLAQKVGRRPVSASCVLEGPRSLRRRRQGHQTRQAAVETVARSAGRHSRGAGVGRLEPADRHGCGDDRGPRRRGWRGTPHREALVEHGRGSRRQAVGGGLGSALLQSWLPESGSGRRRSLPHSLLLQQPFHCRSNSTGAGELRCTGPANRAGVGTSGQVRGKSCSARASDHLVSCRRQSDQRDHGSVGRGRVSCRRSARDVQEEVGDREGFPPNHRSVFAQEPDWLVAASGALPVVDLPADLQRIAGTAHPPGVPPEMRSRENLQREAVLRPEAGTGVGGQVAREGVSAGVAGRNADKRRVARLPASDSARRLERSLVESSEFAWRWAQEGQDARAWQSYVDLPSPSASKSMNKTVFLYLPETRTALPAKLVSWGSVAVRSVLVNWTVP